MAHRFCTRCNAEVEDVGGYCLLGHDLRLTAAADSLTALRAEVNRTFDEARRELVDAMAPAAAVAHVIVAPPASTASPVARPSRFVPPPPAVALDDDLYRVASPPSPDQGSGVEIAATEAPPPAHATVWDDLDDAPLAPGDPITAFAPEPRMDWGPQKTRRFRKTRAPKLPPEA